jgi:hypothetical protein
MKIAALRALIEEKFPDATPITRRSAQPVASGIRELDRALPNGGFPLGRLSLCEPHGGVTAMLRAACANTVANGERAAWVDGARTIAGAYWGGDEVALLVRPTSHVHAVRAADELLRSSAFRLVVLSGVEPSDTEAMRLVRAVHDGGGAFALIAANAATSALRLTSRFSRFRWKRDPFGEPAVVRDVRVCVAVRALGWNAKAEFTLPVQSHDLRLSLEPALADRRGVDRARGAAGARSGSARRNTAHTRAARARALRSVRTTGRRGYPRAHLG